MVRMDLIDKVVGGDEKNSVTVETFKSFLNANKNQDIIFDIASLGGVLSQAIIIHDLIKAHPGKTIANIVGLTASAMTVIALSCDEVNMSDNALFLVHNAWREVSGNVYDLQKAEAELLKNDAIQVKIYREKTGMADDKIKAIMKASDWLSASEAKSLGFIDNVIAFEKRIAASVLIEEARASSISQLLLTKLELKMKNPFKKDAPIMNVLALKDGKNILINAEVAATGVEVAPLGAATLEDGEYSLQDGRTIVVTGGTITEVKEAAPAPAAQVPQAAETEAIVAAVSSIVASEIAKVEAAFDAKLKSIVSTHKPTKGLPNASVFDPAKSVHSRVKEITDGVRSKLEEQRKS